MTAVWRIPDPLQEGASLSRRRFASGGRGPFPYRLPCLIGGAVITALIGCGAGGEVDPTTAGPTAATPVQVGLDRIAAGEAALPAGARVGLVTHTAAVSADGRHSIDILLRQGVDVVRLFAPEHGLRSRAAAGEHIADGRDPVSGLPVVSLYGDTRKPQPEHLRDLDALVFDLQGAGVRFYTYVSTLILSLEAAAEAGIELIVLDRPNPLGGERVEGPLAAPRDVVAASFVNMAPGPLVHGLTLGEIARYLNSRRSDAARLRVVPMRGWRRTMTWADTGREWVPPSPNLVSPEAALAYPGTALLEATNVSEGRGTPTPFLLFGAPWLTREAIDPEALATPGFRLTPTQFTPAASAAAPQPKYLGQSCTGFKVEVIDAERAQSYRLGLELLSALSRQEGFEWRRNGEALTWLLGTPAVYEALAAGRSVEEILAADRGDHLRWREQRGSALLY